MISSAPGAENVSGAWHDANFRVQDRNGFRVDEAVCSENRWLSLVVLAQPVWMMRTIDSQHVAIDLQSQFYGGALSAYLAARLLGTYRLEDAKSGKWPLTGYPPRRFPTLQDTLSCE